MKRILAILLAFVMVVGFAGCAKGKEVEAPAPTEIFPAAPPTKVLNLLIPVGEDPWNAAAAVSAQTELVGLEAAGDFDVNLLTYTDAQQQSQVLNDLAANLPKDGSQGVVVMPASREMADAFAALTQANVAYALAGTIPAGADAASLANVSYDQRGIGAATAAYLVSKGLTQQDKVLIIQGLSEEEAERTEGFQLYLQGKLAVDGQTIQTPWTSLENLVYSDMQGDTQSSAESYFDTYMETSDHAGTKYIATWNDAYVLGILEALQGETIDSKIKETFLSGSPIITGCGGSQALVNVLLGTSELSSLTQTCQIGTIVYSPNLLKLAVQAMVSYFYGVVVEQDQTQPITWITPETAGQYQGY